MRRSIGGIERVRRALSDDEPVRLVLAHREDRDPAILEILALAEQRGAQLWLGGSGDLLRMSRGDPPDRVLAMLGPPLASDLETLCASEGPLWLLHQASYPSNVGFAVRTVEVAGAAGLIVDARFNHEARSRVSHVSMGADRVMPVLWASTSDAIACAKRNARRVIALEAIEKPRARPLWEVDLTGPVLLIAGNERDGIGEEVLAQCDAIATLPMAGFVPSYNLHAAIAAVAVERLRQLASRAPRETTYSNH